MRTKAPRLVIATATVALMSLAGFAAPADAAKPSTQRTVWCC